MNVSNGPTIGGAVLAALTLSTHALLADESRKHFLFPEDQNTVAVEDTVRSEVVAKLSLGSGPDATQLEPVAIPDVSGEYTFGVLEENRGSYGLDDFPALRNSKNPRELFSAFAPEGELEPAILLNKFAPPKIGKVGWGTELVEKMPAVHSASSASCSWTNFKNSFNSYHPEINGAERWYSAVNGDHGTATGDFPTYPYANTTWINWTANASPYPWNIQYKNYAFYNIDKYKTKVKVCTLTPGNAYQNRYIAFRFRRENSSAGVAYSKQLSSANVGWTYSWHWPASSSSSQKNYDWVTRVGGATVFSYSHPNDKFFVAVQKK